MVEIKRKLKMFFTEDVYSKGLALLFAIALWFVFGIQNPETDKSIRNIPIEVVNTGGTGLDVVSSITKRAEVTFKGKRSVVTAISAADIYAYVDISKIETPGEYSLEVFISTAFDDIIITRKNPETVVVVLDSIKSKEIPVKVSFDNKLPADYMLDTYTITPETVIVKGPANELSHIDHAIAVVGLSDERTTVTAAAEYTFYTSDGEVLKPTNISVDAKQVSVTVNILKKKELPLTVNFMNNIYGDATINQVISPEAITVAGPESEIDKLTTLVIGNVDVSMIDTEQEFTFEIKLPDGIRNLNNVNTATAKVSIVSAITRIFNVDLFELVNVPEGFDATVLSDLIEVRVRGNNDVINTVTLENLKIEIDISKIEANTGEYEVPATVVVSGIENVVAVGTYTVRVQLTEKPVENTTQ